MLAFGHSDESPEAFPFGMLSAPSTLRAGRPSPSTPTLHFATVLMCWWTAGGPFSLCMHADEFVGGSRRTALTDGDRRGGSEPECSGTVAYELILVKDGSGVRSFYFSNSSLRRSAGRLRLARAAARKIEWCKAIALLVYFLDLEKFEPLKFLSIAAKLNVRLEINI
ncbi:unnamed protein product [Tuber aestivum]|uniref:Uncharacterized protein n=1 Tax=Tuber aestivum TaxID=59557 RepID=A0A292PM42_9PEZI|nr:unnamed protein product [Tuber aestivum]